MNHSICGADCAECMMKNTCKGCTETKGCPFGKKCFIAEYINIGGKAKYQEFKQQLILEFNELHIDVDDYYEYLTYRKLLYQYCDL